MGSMSEHFSAKNEARKAAGLSEWPEDTVEVCKKIRASTPPSTGMDFADNRKNKQRAQVKLHQSLRVIPYRLWFSCLQWCLNIRTVSIKQSASLARVVYWMLLQISEFVLFSNWGVTVCQIIWIYGPATIRSTRLTPGTVSSHSYVITIRKFNRTF